jgi:hypothetical protein
MFKALTCLALGTTAAFSDTFYDNSAVDNGRSLTLPNSTSIWTGDEIIFGFWDGPIAVTNLSFQFRLQNTELAETYSMRARISANDGPQVNGYASPGTILWNSGWFNIGPTSPSATAVWDQQSIEETLGNQPLCIWTENVTLSIQFSSTDTGAIAAVDLFGPQAIGASGTDFWYYNGTSWEVLRFDEYAVDFGMKIEGTTIVPEPSSLALFGIGGLALWARSRRVKSTKTA